MIVVVMGVSGAGKTTVGSALAQHLGWEFLDADEFHPPENVAKMATGTPLCDEDRWPWLERLNAELSRRAAQGHSAVLACSALKEAYRVRLMGGLDKPRLMGGLDKARPKGGLDRARLVYLHADFEVIRARVTTRKHKYMPASLLASQYATLEPPREALHVDAALEVDAAVRQIAADLARRDPARTP